MFTNRVLCPNEECSEYFEYKCDWESAKAGSEHEVDCPICGTHIVFNIEYSPRITNERVKS